MKIKEFIERLSFVEKDIGGNFDIITIHKAKDMIQMTFSNGAITQIYPKPKMPWDT